jgi:hypothetical protein
MSIDTAQQLIGALGAGIGLPDLRLDDDGYCLLSVDDLELHLQYDADGDDLIAFSRLGSLDEDALPQAAPLLLQANLFWSGTNGATLALQPGDLGVMLQNRHAVAGLEPGTLDRWLEGFVTAAEQWTGIVAELNARADADPSATGETTPRPPGGPSPMIQI